MFKSEIISLKFQILFEKLFCVSFLASVVCIYADKCIYLLLTISSQFMLVKQKTKIQIMLVYLCLFIGIIIENNDNDVCLCP